MKKKILSILLTAAMAISLAACGGSSGGAKIESSDSAPASTADSAAANPEAKNPEAVDEDFHIGIVTGSVSQSEDDRRGAEAFQAKYGEDKVTLAIYPDNFTEEPRRRGLTSSASPASPTRTFPRSAPLQTWSSTTTLSPAAI